DGNGQGTKFPDWIKPGVYGSNRQYAFWVWPGFLKTFRQDLIDVLNTVERPVSYSPDFEIQSHDKWTCMVANALGGICVLTDIVARYRRHEAALTGPNTRRGINVEIRRARDIGADHYQRLVRAATTSAAYLRLVAERSDHRDWRAAFMKAASRFDEVARIQEARARMYADRHFRSRLQAFAQIWRLGGYQGDRFTAMGMASALKDAARVLGLLR
ncbi:MAG TPA: hypothetical protein VJ998_04895, partial [Pseudomonadales bacterium]|nr:hypothetical protein [Pseudomonadales bacterium]